MPEISIIMPVYNAEKYLAECLDSLLAQTFTDWEAICVNDGSKDNSLAILRTYAEKDNRIRILDQANCGAANSRNNAMELATGKYWIFLDSDDRFLPDMLAHLYRDITSAGAQISICAYQAFDTTSGKHLLTAQYHDRVANQKMPFSLKTTNLAFLDFHYAPWVYLYSADFIKSLDLKFQDIPRNNDIYFTISALFAADSVTLNNEPLVDYRMGMTSNLQSGRYKTPLTFLDAYDAIYERFERNGLLPIYKQRFAEYVLESGLVRMRRCQGRAPLQTIFDAYREKAIPMYVPADCLANVTSEEQKQFYRMITEAESLDDFLLQALFHSESAEKVAQLYGEIDVLKEKYDEVCQSTTYRLGRIILWLPRKIVQLLKGRKNG